MNYHKIEKFSIENGTGIRVVLWVSGCSLHCKGCHNPETHPFDSGKLFDEKAEKELFEALDKPYIQGITFSGGHPLESQNIDTICYLCHEIKTKFPNKDIWLYTGHTLNITNFTTLKRGILPDCVHHNAICNTLRVCDVVVDGRFIENEKDISLPFRGSRNQRIIDVQKSIVTGKIVLYKMCSMDYDVRHTTNNATSSSENIGSSLKLISQRLTQFLTEIEDAEVSRCCQNCKHRHGVEGYDQQWGMYYCFQSWCKKDKQFMDTINGITEHYITECPEFEQGEGTYDRMERIY